MAKISIFSGAGGVGSVLPSSWMEVAGRHEHTQAYIHGPAIAGVRM